MKIDQLMEMAYPPKVAEDIIIGMARPINHHLVKLVGFDFPPKLRDHFRRELRNWLNEIQRIRLKPTTRTGSFRFYFDPLFDYPFGGIEVPNICVPRWSLSLANTMKSGRPSRRKLSG